MKRNAVIAVVVATGLLLGASPAAALSCAPPEPIDMEARIAAADAAAVGTITAISSSGDNDLGGNELLLTVEVSAVFKGTVRPQLTVLRSTSIWGPYYEVGEELALLITDGVVGDGKNSLCGPYFYPAEMRAAGGEPTSPEPHGWQVFNIFKTLLDILAMLFGR